MSYYSITYDLCHIKDYERMHKGIEVLSKNVWLKPTLSQYIIQTHLNARQIVNCLLNYIDRSDSLFVIKIDINNLAYRQLAENSVSWLESTRQQS